MDRMTPEQVSMTMDDLTSDMWDQVIRAYERGKDADEVLANGGFFKEPLLTPTQWYGQAPAPKTAARIIADLRLLREAIEQCSEETLGLFNDAVDPRDFDKHPRGEDFPLPPTLLERLEFAEWLYPSNSAQLAAGDKELVVSVLGRPLRYRHLEPTIVLLTIWKSRHRIAIGGKRNQSLARGNQRYAFAPMIEFVGDVLLAVDRSLETDEPDRPTSDADLMKRRTSVENARLVAWNCATQLKTMSHFENSAKVRRLFEIDD